MKLTILDDFENKPVQLTNSHLHSVQLSSIELAEGLEVQEHFDTIPAELVDLYKFE